MAALIKAQSGTDVDLVVGGRGEFTVWVGEERVSGKGPNGFPDDGEVVAAVSRALRKS